MFFLGAIKKIDVAIFVNPLQAHCSTDPKNNKHRPNKSLQNKRFSVAKQRFKDRGKKVLYITAVMCFKEEKTFSNLMEYCCVCSVKTHCENTSNVAEKISK